MVRLADLHQAGRESAERLECPQFEDRPFVPVQSLKDRTVAIVSTAGLIKRGEKPFRRGDASYREFPADMSNNDVVLSHMSVNFDRLAAHRNIEALFPRETLAQMAAEGSFKAAARAHYSFMGASDPADMEPYAKEVAEKLRNEGVDTAVLLPV